MNTELSPEITRTCSNTHGKIANNNSFRLSRNNIRLQCLELSNNMLQELIMEKKAWHESTNCIDQKSLTDHEPKRIRKYDGTHVNIASYITDSNMAGTTIRRHVDELVPLTTEQYMAWQGNQQ